MKPGEQVDRQSRILEAALDLLSRHGISGVSMRAVAREAGVALGLVNYYYEDKLSLIRAALHRIGQHDLMLVTPDPRLVPRRAAEEGPAAGRGPGIPYDAVPVPAAPPMGLGASP